MPPYHVADLYDYLGWFEEHLDQLGGILHTEDGHLDVQLLGDPPCLLVIERHRLEFYNRSYLDFELRVDDSLEVREYRYHFARADRSMVWRLDKHELPGSQGGVPHIHLPPNERDHIPHGEVEVQDVVRLIYESGELDFLPA